MKAAPFTSDGYLLDSGNPYRLRFHFRLGIGMQNVVQRYRLNRNGLLHETEEELAAALRLRSSPVEPEGELVQVVVKMVTVQTPMIVDFGEGGGWVRAGPGDDSESQPVDS
jgi:hypothetical protein